MRPPYVPTPLSIRKGADQTPERRLAIALVEDAVQCVLRNVDQVDRIRHQEYLQARAWLLDDARDWPFSFANLCDLLELDIDAVRRSLPLQRRKAIQRRRLDDPHLQDQQQLDHPDAARLQEEQLQTKLLKLKAELLSMRQMRRGSLVSRYRKCGKSNCSCAQPGAVGHGPVFSLTWQEDQRTRTKIVPAAAVEEVKKQIGEYRRFRELCAQIVRVSEKLCALREEGSDKK